MPGHLGRQRPIKRRNSRESEKLEFPVLTHGRAELDGKIAPSQDGFAASAAPESYIAGLNDSAPTFKKPMSYHSRFTDQNEPQARETKSSSAGSSSQEFPLNRDGPSAPPKPSDAEILAAKQENLRWELAHVDEDPVDHSKVDYRGWADKGKELLFGRRKKKH